MENSIQNDSHSNALLQPASRRLLELIQNAGGYASSARSDATLRAYSRDLSAFENWCARFGVAALPADPVILAAYITELADGGHRPSYIERKLVSISSAHKAKGLTSPTGDARVRNVLKGIRRRLGTRQVQKHPLLANHLKTALEALPDTLIGLRDRALLSLGFLGGFRRSELVAIDIADVDFVCEGLVITVRKSKTDQEGVGRTIGIPRGDNGAFDPVATLGRWLSASRITDGALFRPINRHGQILSERLCDRSVARIVKRAVERIGLDPAEFSGHSLRSGFATSAARLGVPERLISTTTGHRNPQMLRRYIREGDLFEHNPAQGLL